MSDEPRSAWDDVQDLAASIGHEAFLEAVMRDRPPLVCRPEPVDFDWSPPHGWMPDELDEPLCCAVHPTEWWPCEAFTAGRGVTPQDPEMVQQLVIRPVLLGESSPGL